MALNPSIMEAVERLDYRVTVGDVSAQAGLNINLAQQELLALASEAGGHLQVSDTGEIVYRFPKNFRAVLRNKFLQLRLQEWWKKVWGILFYLIRISFGILLLASIALIYISIVIIITASSSDRNSNNRSGGDHFGGGFFFYWPDLFWYFGPDYDTRYQRRREGREGSQLNFLEVIFSFLFGDGNPNANLEERRWQEIATVIRNNRGAVVAEQIAPYLDELGVGYAREYEDYMLPVLIRFNGQPDVSTEGQIVYYFPDLQVTAVKGRQQSITTYLEELPWRFSAASSGQIVLATGLGVLNFVGALVLGNLLAKGTITAKSVGIIPFVKGIYWLLIGYGTAFLGVPLIRYFWIQWRNSKISARNERRQLLARMLENPNASLQKKIAYAHQYATETYIGQEDLVYSTETEMLEQMGEREGLGELGEFGQ